MEKRKFIGLSNREMKPKLSLLVREYKNDVKINISGLYSPLKHCHPTVRSKIKDFSFKSGRNLKFILRNCETTWKAFVTLTYPENFPCDGRKVKRDIDLFSDSLRRMGNKYVWVMEFQERGAVHFHCLLSGRIDKNYLSQRWYRIVGSGDEKHLLAGTQVKGITSQEGLTGYLTGYLKKLEQKQIPEEFKNVGRFWGASRNLTSHKSQRFFFDNEEGLRDYLMPLVEYNRDKLKGWNIYWEWQGYGFTVIGGKGHWAKLMGLEDAMRIATFFNKKEGDK